MDKRSSTQNSVERPRSKSNGDVAEEYGYVSRRRGSGAAQSDSSRVNAGNLQNPHDTLKPTRASHPANVSGKTGANPAAGMRTSDNAQKRPDMRFSDEYARGGTPVKRNPPAQRAQSNVKQAAKKPSSATAKPRSRYAVRKSRAVKHEVLSWAITIALALILAIGIRAFVFEIVRVEGPSMNPTLVSDELLLVTKFDYRFASPQRGDVVVCRFPGREGTFVKRVIGLPGDTVQIKDARTYINDALLDESFVSYPAASDYGPVLVGDGQYIVMGDNRAISHDSRSSDVGTLRADAIIGRARRVLYPFDEARSIAE